jgi:hypothetical protein
VPEKPDPEEEPEAEQEEAEGAEDEAQPDSEPAEAAESEPAADEGDEAAADEEPAAEPEAAEAESAQEPEAEQEKGDAEGDADEEPAAEPAVTVTLVADGKAEFRIVLPGEPTDVESFAALELAKYVEKICNVALDVQEGGEEPDKAIFVGGVSEAEMAEQGIRDDGFVIDVSPAAVRLFGGKGRGTLFAVYALLERLGCRWSVPGEDYELTPHRGSIEVEAGRTMENPRFAVRGFAEDTNYVDHDDEAEKDRRTADDIEFIDWLAKNRCSHFHFCAPDDVFELIHYELQQRGLGYETGGHIIPQLLPRELFDEHPGYFRMSTKGNREASGNLCVSNPAALETVRENFLKYVESNPDADLVHFWGEDVHDGGWCCCEECRELLPQDQYLKACNYVAEGLEGTGVSIDYIAYHDTLEADLTVEPHPEVLALFAPRERSYGTSLGDPECETNQLYAEALRQYVGAFNGNVQISEYYADPMLYGSLAVPLHQVIAQDLAFYEELGVKRIEVLMFGRYSWWAYPLNQYAFARLAWDGDADVDEVARDFCQGLFGDAADTMRRVFNIVGEGMRHVATYGDIKHPWRSEVPLPTMLEGVRSAIDLVASAAEPMARAKQQAEDTGIEPLVLSQYQLWLYTLGDVEGTATQIDGLVELESAEKAEDALKGKYLRVADLKLRDAAGIARGGMDIISEVEDEVKGQWGITGLVAYHERLVSHLEKVAQDARDSIPPEPEPQEKAEAGPEAEAAETEAEADAEPEAEAAEAPAETESAPAAQQEPEAAAPEQAEQ